MLTNFEYELEVHDGLDDTYSEILTIDVDFVSHYDNYYGSDADSNRGVCCAAVEDVSITITNESGKDVTKMIKAEFPTSFNVIEEQAWEAAEYESSAQDGG